MTVLQLIQLYFYVCEIYEEELQWHCQRFTKNQAKPLFSDERRFRIKDIHGYVNRHWLMHMPVNLCHPCRSNCATQKEVHFITYGKVKKY